MGHCGRQGTGQEVEGESQRQGGVGELMAEGDSAPEQGFLGPGGRDAPMLLSLSLLSHLSPLLSFLCRMDIAEPQRSCRSKENAPRSHGASRPLRTGAPLLFIEVQFMDSKVHPS